jgi:hypothetical protein
MVPQSRSSSDVFQNLTLGLYFVPFRSRPTLAFKSDQLPICSFQHIQEKEMYSGSEMFEVSKSVQMTVIPVYNHKMTLSMSAQRSNSNTVWFNFQTYMN